MPDFTGVCGKIKTDVRSATNTSHALTNSTVEVLNMAKVRLPDPTYLSKITDQDKADFWSKATVTANPDKCWEWQGYTYRNYGTTSVKGKAWRAHRFAWAITNGREPSLNILHSCDNPPCVNPNHLREGTTQENMAERQSKGRGIRGERVNFAKLTADKAKQIRQLVAEGMPKKQAARLFGVAPSSIRSLIKRKTWRHV